jgi:hypothetical protein
MTLMSESEVKQPKFTHQLLWARGSNRLWLEGELPEEVRAAVYEAVSLPFKRKEGE